jgi:hypothetical protein
MLRPARRAGIQGPAGPIMRSTTLVLSTALSLGAISFAQAEASCEISRGPVELAATRTMNEAAMRGRSPAATPVSLDKRKSASRASYAPMR